MAAFESISSPEQNVINEQDLAENLGLGLFVRRGRTGPLTVSWTPGRVRLTATTTLDISENTNFSVVNNATTYIFVDSLGAVTSNTTGYPTTALVLMARVIAANGLVTQIFNDVTPFYVPSGGGGGGVSETQHRTLRQLIHLVDGDGPFNGFASGAYQQTLPAGSAFPTSYTWWESVAMLKKIVDTTITYNPNKTFNTVTYRAYDTDGVTVVETATDTYDYSGGNFLTPKITRTLT